MGGFVGIIRIFVKSFLILFFNFNLMIFMKNEYIMYRDKYVLKVFIWYFIMKIKFIL